MANKNRLHISERIKLNKIMEGVITVVGDRASYAPGWSDERVAVDVGATTKAVEYHRRQMFGKLATKADTARKKDPTAQLIANFNKLVLELGMKELQVEVSHD